MNRRGFFAAIAATAFVAIAERTRLGRTVVDVLPKDEFSLAYLDHLREKMRQWENVRPVTLFEPYYVLYASASRFALLKQEFDGSGVQVKQLDRVLRL